MAQTSVAPIQRQPLLGRITSFFVYLFERVMPDPYVFAVLLTVLVVVLAHFFANTRDFPSIARAWYGGVFEILTFAFQMVLMMVTGYALASAPPVHRGLARLASVPKTPADAISMTVFVSLIASWLNWGVGLVVAALLAREIAKRVPVDFGWLVAAAYSGFVISTEGLSGSIVLSQATHGSALNIVEKVTGILLPLSQTVFTRFNLIPVVFLVVVLPFLFRWIGPSVADAIPADRELLEREDKLPEFEVRKKSLGSILDFAWIISLFLVALGCFALVLQLIKNKFSLDLNSVILLLFLLGVLLHWRPIAYVTAVKRAGRVTGPFILQYPLYGGLMGIMTTTGLAAVISQAFLRFSTAHTLPLYTYLTSLVITLFVPSGGGHWAVQGPFAVPAAQALHASLPATTMAVAMGESVANMLQPFWALPLLSIAGIPMRRVMGFLVITFFVSLLAFGLSLLLLAPY